MNMMIKHFALAVALLAAPALSAQKQGDNSYKTPAEKAAQHTTRMTKELGLSQEQTIKVGDINLRFAEALDGVKGSTLEKADKKEQAKGMKEKRDQELQLVLTPEQHAKMLELRKTKTAEVKSGRSSKQATPEAPPHNE